MDRHMKRGAAPTAMPTGVVVSARSLEFSFIYLSVSLFALHSGLVEVGFLNLAFFKGKQNVHVHVDLQITERTQHFIFTFVILTLPVLDTPKALLACIRKRQSGLKCR